MVGEQPPLPPSGGELGGGWGGRRKTYGAVCGFEAVEFLARGRELLGRGDLRLQARFGHLPEFFVLGFEQHDGARRLGVEGAGHVEEGLAHYFGDAGVGDRGGVAEGVDAAAGLHGGEE